MKKRISRDSGPSAETCALTKNDLFWNLLHRNDSGADSKHGNHCAATDVEVTWRGPSLRVWVGKLGKPRSQNAKRRPENTERWGLNAP